MANEAGYYIVKVDSSMKSGKPIAYSDKLKPIINCIVKTKYGKIFTLALSSVIGMIVYVSAHYAGEYPFQSICTKN